MRRREEGKRKRIWNQFQEVCAWLCDVVKWLEFSFREAWASPKAPPSSCYVTTNNSLKLSLSSLTVKWQQYTHLAGLLWRLEIMYIDDDCYYIHLMFPTSNRSPNLNPNIKYSVWLWTRNLISLCLSFLICYIVIVIFLTSLQFPLFCKKGMQEKSSVYSWCKPPPHLFYFSWPISLTLFIIYTIQNHCEDYLNIACKEQY